MAIDKHTGSSSDSTSGSTSESSKVPTGIELHKRSGILALSYADGSSYQLSCEFLRVHSPSAEVQGHGPGQEVLQIGKKHVAIEKIIPVGHYAIQLIFDDGHDSGIFSWRYLEELGENQEEKWQAYLDKLHEAGKGRDPEVQVIRIGD